MAVVLTGGTGLVGGAVLRALRAAGREVTALVRSDSSATQVEANGATAVVGDLTDGAWVRAQVQGSDGAIHTASPGDASSADFDKGIAESVVAVLAGTGKPYVHTGGAWVWGSCAELTEQESFDAPALTAWRADVESLVLGADGVRGVVVAPGIVYGDGGGIPAMLTVPDDSGRFRLIGDGSQHWTTVRHDQLADLYVRAFENGAAAGYYLGVNDDHPTVRDIVEAAAGGREVVAESVDASRDRLGELFADALLLDQIASHDRATSELGWTPTGPSLLDEIRNGSYAS